MAVIPFPDPQKDWENDTRANLMRIAEAVISGEYSEVIVICRTPEPNAPADVELFGEEIPDFCLTLGMLESAKSTILYGPVDFGEDDDDYVQ